MVIRRSRIVALIVAAVLTSAVVGAVQASGSVPTSRAAGSTSAWTATWHAPHTIAAPVEAPRVLSCPAGHCYGMDVYGNFLDSGTGQGDWINRGTPGGESATAAQASCPRFDNACGSLSCPQAGHCVSVDSQGRPQTWSGGTWRAAPSLDEYGTHTFDHTPLLSCATTTFCVAMDSGGDYSVYRGTSWSRTRALNGTMLTSAPQIRHHVAWDNGPTALSCAGGQCMMVTSDDAYRYTGSDWVGGGNQRWTTREGDIGPEVQDVSCANVATTGTKLLCGAAGNDATIVYANGSWGGIDYAPKTTSISCRSDGRCLGVAGGCLGYCGGYNSDFRTYEYGDHTLAVDKFGWSAAMHGPKGTGLGNSYDLACYGARTCRISIGRGISATYDLTRHAWSTPTSILAIDDGITGLSCSITSTSSRYCLAGTLGPDLVTDSGTGWSAPVATFDRGERTAAISCVDKTSFCLAVANNSHFASAANQYVTYSAGTLVKHSMPTGVYRQLSCWSTTGCFAVSDAGILRWDGSAWSVAFDSARRHKRIVDIACLAGNPSCIAVTFGDYAFRINKSTTGRQVYMNRTSTDQRPVGVACVRSDTCIATVDDFFFGGGELFSETAMDWRDQGPLSQGEESYSGGDVACAPSTTEMRCLAVGPYDASKYDGTMHEMRLPNTNANFVATRSRVTCPSVTACYVGDVDGRVRTFS